MRLNYFLTSLLSASILFSCSSDDSSDTSDKKTNPIIINSIESSKEFAFIEDEITLSIDAEGYSDITVTSNDSSIEITKVNTTTYTIKASEIIETSINVELTYEGFSETKNIDLEFYEHGVINYNIVEGIEVDIDYSEKLTTLLGEPNYKEINNNETSARWHYFDLGMRFQITLETNIVENVRLYGKEYVREYGDIKGTSGIYEYEIGNSLKIANEQLTTDTVLETYGSNYENEADTSTDYLFKFDYKDIDIAFFYFSGTIEEYTGKTIPYINIY